jgi:hypothetical protein
MTRPNIYFFLGIIFLVLTWLFVGFFRDDEFYEPKLFTKHRPTFKVNFYSPIGMQDMKLNSLPPGRKAEEIAFREFVLKQHVQYNSDARLWYLPFILIQLTLTFFSFALLKTRRNLSYKKWQLPVHFVICLLLTSLGIAFILAFDTLLLTLLVSAMVLAINYFTLVLLTRRNLKQVQ